ncbi:hypothetical protein BC937DRAFT_93349 [Endogone sp. FLAS-F59071]|nr:hypothetical protein BC937DRAFT_93349 [Endogone sp. FLAS-F59071]|eukprot:RUS14782.1 hypothetical protein BC937DRAFT_93349 [Endogone sp. FLAS-F59071]
MPVMLAAVPCNGYLKRLEAYNFNVFEPKVQIRDWKLPLQLWSSYRKNGDNAMAKKNEKGQKP